MTDDAMESRQTASCKTQQPAALDKQWLDFEEKGIQSNTAPMVQSSVEIVADERFRKSRGDC
jgi:hypothetical protein